MAEQPYRLLLLNGPNLNLLGTREPTVYGQQTLAQIEQALTEQARAAGAELSTLQSNAEHELVDAVQAAAGSGVDFILINQPCCVYPHQYCVTRCLSRCWGAIN